VDLSSSFGISSTDIGKGFSHGFLLVCVAGRASTSTRLGAPEAHGPPRPATLTVAVFLTIGGASALPLEAEYRQTESYQGFYILHNRYRSVISDQSTVVVLTTNLKLTKLHMHQARKSMVSLVYICHTRQSHMPIGAKTNIKSFTKLFLFTTSSQEI